MRPSLSASPVTRSSTEHTRARPVPLATLVSATLPPRADASPNPKNPTLHRGMKRFFVVHGSPFVPSEPGLLNADAPSWIVGGLFSREDVLLSEIRDVDRLKQKQPGQEGLMCEMLWTDPQDQNGRGPSKRVSLFARLLIALASVRLDADSVV